jgi:hypothetical protein
LSDHPLQAFKKLLEETTVAMSELTASSNPQTQQISRIQSLTGGSSPWSSYVVGFIVGGLLMFLMIKHGRALRRGFRNGEKFVLHHPLLDITVLSFIALGVILLQQAGTIL